MAQAVPDVAAGELRYRIAFEKRAAFADGAGNTEGGWELQFKRWGRITALKGGETVTAMRLQGMSPAIIRVRCDSSTRLVTPQWRCIDVIRETAYNVRSIQNEDELNIWLAFMCESGGPN